MVVTTWNSLLFFGMNGAIMLIWIALLFFLVKVLLLIPVEFLRWVIIALAGGASSWFIALNLKECTQGADLMVLMASASVLQFALALFIKVFFFAWGCLLILQRSASLFLTPQYPPSLPLLNWGFGTEKKKFFVFGRWPDALFVHGLFWKTSFERAEADRPVLLDNLTYIFTLDCCALGILHLKWLICKFFSS